LSWNETTPPPDPVEQLIERSRTAKGLPPTITDPGILSAVAAAIKGSATAGKRPRATPDGCGCLGSLPDSAEPVA